MEPKHREAAYLYVAEGLTQTQISAKLGIPQTTLSDALRRPEIAAYCDELGRELDAQVLRSVGSLVRRNTARMGRLADKLSFRLQLDSDDKDLPPGQPHQHALYIDRFLATDKALRERLAQAETSERHRFDLDAAKAELNADAVQTGSETEGDKTVLPPNGRERHHPAAGGKTD